MNLWTMIFLVVAVSTISGVLIERYKAMGRIADSRAGADRQAGDDGGTRRELADLRERIKVLEQITVDGREAKAIADEIERLRDRQG